MIVLAVNVKYRQYRISLLSGSETHKAAGGGSGITIFSGQGCFSSVGKSGLFRVSLGRGCKDHGVSLHELGHVLGLHHEQVVITSCSVISYPMARLISK